jgi:hypothetical protein
MHLQDTSPAGTRPGLIGAGGALQMSMLWQFTKIPVFLGDYDEEVISFLVLEECVLHGC